MTQTYTPGPWNVMDGAVLSETLNDYGNWHIAKIQKGETMTRINLVPPNELCNQHLIAEYRELPRVFALARPLPDSEMPKQYTLGKGHVKFFYDKLTYLENRFTLLVNECIKRGFNIQYTQPKHSTTIGLHNNYTPTQEALELNRERINLRMPKQPRWGTQ
jgi:deoxyribonuclease (pyrimidine dimer)